MHQPPPRGQDPTSPEIVVDFSSGDNLAKLVSKSPPVPPGGTLVIQGWGVTATLPVDTPALRERALKNLEEVRAVMKQRGIGMVVLREPKGGREQVVTMTELMTRANAERAAVSPLPLPPSTPLTPAEIGVDPRTGVMTIKLRPAHDRFSVLEQAMREAQKWLRKSEQVR